LRNVAGESKCGLPAGKARVQAVEVGRARAGIGRLVGDRRAALLRAPRHPRGALLFGDVLPPRGQSEAGPLRCVAGGEEVNAVLRKWFFPVGQDGQTLCPCRIITFHVKSSRALPSTPATCRSTKARPTQRAKHPPDPTEASSPAAHAVADLPCPPPDARDPPADAVRAVATKKQTHRGGCQRCCAHRPRRRSRPIRALMKRLSLRGRRQGRRSHVSRASAPPHRRPQYAYASRRQASRPGLGRGRRASRWRRPRPREAPPACSRVQPETQTSYLQKQGLQRLSGTPCRLPVPATGQRSQ